MATADDAKKGMESVTDYHKGQEMDVSNIDMKSIGADEDNDGGSKSSEEIAIAPEHVTMLANELLVSREKAYDMLVSAKGSVTSALQAFVS
jgi:hypothetical protein